MDNIQVMVTLFIIMVLGYVMGKLGYMDKDFNRRLSAIVVDITCPLLILSSVMGKDIPDRRLILPLLGVGVLTYVVLTVYALLLPRLYVKDEVSRGVCGFAIMFANVGFIGYPIVASIFGQKAVFYAALLNMANTFFIFTVGTGLIKGRDKTEGKHRIGFNPKILLSPAMVAAYIATLVVALQIHVPVAIAQPVTMVGNITIPVSLMVIGASMSELPLKDMMGNATVYATTFFRLAFVPLTLFFIFRAIGVEPLVNDINTVVIAMPVASFGTMFSLKYNRGVKLMTEITFITTVLSMVTIPLITLLFK